MPTKTQQQLLESLKSAEKCVSKLPWSPPVVGTVGKVFRLLRMPPVKMLLLVRQLLAKKVFGKCAAPIRCNTFFGQSMFTDDIGIWICGCLSAECELRLIRYLINNTSDSDVFFDIGAHNGFYSVLAKRLGAKEIHAFEPADIQFHPLSVNAADGIVANKMAVYSRNDRLKFYMQSACNSTVDPNIFNKFEAYKDFKFTETEVDAVTLDSYCDSRGVVPALIKIDVEGAEYDVVAGALQTLKAHSPRVIMEVLRSPVDYSNHLKAIKLLADHGYVPFRICDDGSAERVKDIVPDRDIPANETADNFLFIKEG